MLSYLELRKNSRPQQKEKLNLDPSCLDTLDHLSIGFIAWLGFLLIAICFLLIEIVASRIHFWFRRKFGAQKRAVNPKPIKRKIQIRRKIERTGRNLEVIRIKKFQPKAIAHKTPVKSDTTHPKIASLKTIQVQPKDSKAVTKKPADEVSGRGQQTFNKKLQRGVTAHF